jgi:hypothetical protein
MQGYVGAYHVVGFLSISKVMVGFKGLIYFIVMVRSKTGVNLVLRSNCTLLISTSGLINLWHALL